MKQSSWLLFLLIGSVVSSVASSHIDTVAVKKLDSVSVISVRIDEDIVNGTPMQSFDKSDMNRLNIIDMTDGFNKMAGITLRDYGGAGGLKTVSVRGLGASHTAVNLDGITQMDVQTGQVDFSRYNLININQVRLIVADEFDLLQSARAASASAIVDLRTEKIPTKKKNFVALTIEQGSFERYGTQLLWQQKLCPTWTIQAIGHYLFVGNNYPYTLINGIQKEKKIRQNNRVNTYSTDIASLWQVNNLAMLNVKCRWYDNYFRMPGKVILFNPSNDERQHNRQFWTNMSWTQQLSDKSMLKIRGKWDWNENKYKDIDAMYPNGIWEEHYWQRELYLSGVISYDVMKCLKMSYALDYFYNDLNSNQYLNGNVSRRSLLQSLTAKFNWNRVTINGRIICSNYDNHADGTESAKKRHKWNSSASISWKLLPKEHLYARTFYKNIFRLPTFTESYYYHLGNTDLRPETTCQYGAGLSWQKNIAPYWRALKITVDGYYNNIDDKIISIPLNLHQWRTVNMGRVCAVGCDITMENQWQFNMKNTLILKGAVSWQSVTDRTDVINDSYKKQLAYSPSTTGSLSLAYENDILNGAFSISGSSAKWATNEHAPSTRIPGYVEMSVSLWRTFILMNLLSVDTKLSVQNITNKQYDIVKGYPMPGRAYRMSLTIKI